MYLIDDVHQFMNSKSPKRAYNHHDRKVCFQIMGKSDTNIFLALLLPGVDTLTGRMPADQTRNKREN